ncbi:MAG: RHS repeat-associated core domain-containing protein [Acidobacteria bacterium]|nr:RHS repeat-associated core domain-containing protein [Acidobacteriota bacterium]
MNETKPSSWGRTYTYDRYGSRAVTGLQVGVGTPTATSAFTASNNRLTSTWANYDTSGNQTAAKIAGAQWSAAYDGEMHQRYFCANTTVACTVSIAQGAYSYDGEGNRIQKLTAGVTTNYVYDAFGQLAAEYTTGGPAQTAGRFFRTTDHLGSTRLVTNSAGAVVSRRDSFPFGEQILANASSGRTSANLYNTSMGFPQLFTGKERDVESGLDYFLARYYSSGLGRFTSADMAGPDPLNPQTLNKYRYALNNPLRFSDPNGLYEEDVHLDLTTTLALAAGISSSIATRIGDADQYVDDNPATSPLGKSPIGDAVSRREKFHFTSDARRNALYAAFESSGSPEDLGTFFHAQQDSYSHA